MEYIQCTNCEKKYNVNDKVRAFTGSEIKCKSCQEKFTIIIHDTEKPNSEEKQSEPQSENKANEQDTTNTQIDTEDTNNEKKETAKPESTPKSAKNKINIQLLFTIFLAITLVAALGFLLFSDSLFVSKSKVTQNKTLQPILINPQISIPENNLDIIQNDKKTADTTVQTDVTKPDTPVAEHKEAAIPKTIESELAEPKEVATKRVYSPECKKAAASQWSIDSTIYHKELPNSKYMQLLDLSQEQSATVRELCKDDKVIQEILAAAKNKTKPSWF
ncbi:MAG: hypothetical protein R8M46_00615 [Ghiorsea sp.]